MEANLSSWLGTLVALGVFTLGAVGLIFRMIKYGGFRAANYGAGIKRTAGELDISSNGQGVSSISIKVLSLESESTDKTIGLEIAMKSFHTFNTMPVALSTLEASKLVKLLQDEIEANNSKP